MRTEVKWGLILGFSVVVWTLAIHALGFYTTNIGAGKKADIVAAVLPIIAIVAALIERRRRTGSLTIGQAVLTGVVVGLVSIPITVGFLWIYHRYMNPRWVDHLVDYERASGAAANRSAEEIQKAVDQLRQTGTDKSQILGGVIGTTIMAAFLGLVGGVFLRRKLSSDGAGET